MKFVELFVVIWITVVGGGTLIGSFFCWLADKRSDAEIKKHDKEVARKMREKYSQIY